ncbi:F-box/kelch-repeat protein At3g06240-like [Lotus japonicus]|uniref:F-box/kelch-repeat protein At3g06240-like n=1 Tax=Lotus japonicus TaxID=34305 RepID=UPI0025873FC4|nr:F-box/kelch-repeat protein At3g06240-like [Lotus japonicus]
MNTPRAARILPSEIVIEIFSWLPVKTLMQIKCLSKSWKSFISNNPKFAKLHLKRSPNNTHILLAFKDDINYDDEETCFISCSMRRLLEDPSSMIDEDKCYHLKGKYLVVGSCNGLVCLGNSHDAGLIEEFWVRFWNPTTRLSSEKSPTFQMNLRTQEFVSRGKMNCGFGYDDLHDTYKVVVVFWDCTQQKMEIWVHCMGDSCWRNILSNPPLLQNQISGHFVGGCVNWLAIDKLNGPNYQWGNVTLQNLKIFSFDLRKEKYKLVPLPQGINEVPHVEPDLGVLRNHMCLIHDHERTHFVVWKMTQYAIQESWTRLVSISYEHLNCDGFRFRPLPICLFEDDDSLLLAYTEEVVMYNLRDNSLENIQLPNNKYWLNVNGYVQSLVLPCHY